MPPGGPFYVVWSAMRRFTPLEAYDTRAEAIAACEKAAERTPGVDVYVLQATHIASVTKPGKPTARPI